MSSPTLGTVPYATQTLAVHVSATVTGITITVSSGEFVNVVGSPSCYLVHKTHIGDNKNLYILLRYFNGGQANHPLLSCHDLVAPGKCNRNNEKLKRL